MSVVLAGTAAHITTPISATVSAMADNGSGAIRVTTAAPHLFGSTDSVNMATTVLSANGPWSIVVIDASHFDLVGSAFSGTGTGTVTDNSLTPPVLCPTDGDPSSAQLSGMLSAYQSILDRTQYLQQQQLSTSVPLQRNAAAQVAQNWPQVAFGLVAPGAPTGTGSPQVIHWNDASPGNGPSAQSWVFTGGDGNGQRTAFSGGMDQIVTSLGGVFVPGGTALNLPVATALANNSAGDLYMGHQANGSLRAGGIYLCPVGGSWGTSSVVTFGFTTCTDVQLARLGASNVIFAATSTTASSGQLGTISGGVAVASVNLGQSLILKSNGTVAILTDRFVSNGTIYTTTSGTSWPSYSASSQFGTGVQVIDITWNGSLSLWFALVTQGGSVRIFRSADAINWLPVSIIGGLGASFQRINAFGVALVAIASAVPGVGRVCYSVDGGATWYQTGAIVTGSAGSTAPIIKSSPTQLAIAAQEVSSNAVQPARFSQVYGLPTGHL